MCAFFMKFGCLNPINTRDACSKGRGKLSATIIIPYKIAAGVKTPSNTRIAAVAVSQ